jgi:hypothetical protein
MHPTVKPVEFDAISTPATALCRNEHRARAAERIKDAAPALRVSLNGTGDDGPRSVCLFWVLGELFVFRIEHNQFAHWTRL